MVEWFLLSLQRSMCRDWEDKVIWTRSKNGKFSIKALYLTLETGSTMPFPASVIWNSWVPLKMGFFWLGGFLGKGVNFGPFKEERVVFNK